jgi:hypothetical protein
LHASPSFPYFDGFFPIFTPAPDRARRRCNGLPAPFAFAPVLPVPLRCIARLIRPVSRRAYREKPLTEKEKTMTTRNRNYSRKEKARNTQPPALIAYHVAERGEKAFWTRIGAAWDHEDAKGLTLQLELLPANGGRIVLREPNAEEGEAGDGEGA